MIKINKNILINKLNENLINSPYLKLFLSGNVGKFRKYIINIFIQQERNDFKLYYNLNLFGKILMYLVSPLNFLIYGFWKNGAKEFKNMILEINQNQPKSIDVIKYKDAKLITVNE